MSFPLVTLLAATLAAPVPVDKVAENKKLEAAWEDLVTYDPVVRTRAVFALCDHPRAVPFLAEKLPPVDVSADQLKAWVKDLNVSDEKVWKAAFEKLQYFDPRTGLTLAEQTELAITDCGRRRLASLWWADWIGDQPDCVSSVLSLDGPDAFTLTQHFRDPRTGRLSQSDHSGTVRTVAGLAPTRWRQAAIAAHVLHRIDTKASRAALDRLAAGHKDTLPTRTAVGLLKATAAPASSDAGFNKGWDGLLSGEPIPATEWALSLRDRPDDVKRMAGVLPAIQATPDDVKGWLKALDDTDPKVWKPAFEKLLYFRPLLAVPTDTQCKLVTTDHGRAALFHLTRFAPGVPEKIDLKEGSSLAVRDGRMVLEYVSGRRFEIESTAVESLDKMTSIHWQRARLAVVALERMKTDDAKAVLKQLAAGHPDILPTKEAKAALERLK